MSRGLPSMTALLGLLAIAGYQNRDKLGELLKARPAMPRRRRRPSKAPLAACSATWVGLWLAEGPEACSAEGSANCSNGSSRTGKETRRSPGSTKVQIRSFLLLNWNEPSERMCWPRWQQMGLSQEELLAQLSRELPAAVDQYPPDRTPSELNTFNSEGITLLGIIWTIIIGFVAGVIAKFIMPGDNEPSGFIRRPYSASSARSWRRFWASSWVVSARRRRRPDRRRGGRQWSCLLTALSQGGAGLTEQLTSVEI